MKKILIIGPFPEPTTGVSLANKVVHENLLKKGYEVDFIDTSYNKFDENLGSVSLHKIFFYFKINFLIYKVLTHKVIYLTTGQTFFGVVKYSLYIIVSKIFRREIIVHVHGNYLGKEYETLKGIKKAIFKGLLKMTSKGIVLSESLKDNMTSFIPESHIYVVNNFVEDYLFVDKDTIEEKLLDTTTPRIIFLSNLMEEKGILVLLEALSKLEKEGVEYEAKIAGNIDARYKAKIDSYFSRLKHAEYCGVVSGNDKKSLLLWGNIFVLPTYYSMEGQPISILEAMATGNLILTTNHAGIPDIFKEHENGLYVKKKNADNIASQIKKILDSAEESNKMRINNFKTAKEKFRVESFIVNIEKVFKV